jgi:uncharacterized membrane protein YcfT
MGLLNVRLHAMLEFSVILFQVGGVAALCLSRLVPAPRWASRSRVGFVVSLVGLGIAGALCGRHDSEFALFAGGTMTVLLIGMTSGGGPIDPIDPALLAVSSEPRLAA